MKVRHEDIREGQIIRLVGRNCVVRRVRAYSGVLKRYGCFAVAEVDRGDRDTEIALYPGKTEELIGRAG